MAIIGLGGGELAFLFVALIVSLVLMCGFVLVGIWLIKRSANRPQQPSGRAQPFRRCPHCGAELAADVPQGACPNCKSVLSGG